MNPIYAKLGTTIFEEMSLLARRFDAINLGQGFPDTDGALEVRQAAADALLTRPNQYPPTMGMPELRNAVAEHYARFQNLSVGPEHVLITSGGTEALAASILGLISPGDEVVMIQPMYDAYRPMVEQAGGVARYITLEPPAWRITLEQVEAAFAGSPKLLVFNDPLNPVGRAFDKAEIDLLASACHRHDTIAICDEVWEHVLFEGRRHWSLLGVPETRRQAVKIGSAGKIFSMTGWKVGFVVADPVLLQPIARAHQFLTFSTPPALQIGIAHGLAKDEGWFAQSRCDFQRARDCLSDVLRGEGFAVLPSEGTYFLCVDLRASGISMEDQVFCRRAVEEARVAAIPLSSFYHGIAQSGIVRLCFAKQADVLQEAGRRLGAWRRSCFSPTHSG
jgi:aspartate/methionine/tyrosine aminotransferase